MLEPSAADEVGAALAAPAAAGSSVAVPPPSWYTYTLDDDEEVPRLPLLAVAPPLAGTIDWCI